ncbi:MAG TPA: hypothetical protein VEP90_12585 [Methylomirabilota bacterium]|nr:hypothetical protein [Methylomirabilota bacterium]
MTKMKFKTGRKRTLFVTPGRTYRLAIQKKHKGKKQQTRKIVKEVHIPRK